PVFPRGVACPGPRRRRDRCPEWTCAGSYGALQAGRREEPRDHRDVAIARHEARHPHAGELHLARHLTQKGLRLAERQAAWLGHEDVCLPGLEDLALARDLPPIRYAQDTPPRVS